ncbi:cytochrome d ubiquinol oxidase subunit II [Trinickia sp. NRRL B-1857]|uniref:cytochrome d ubiquinol oxidase subunit II n=1 Tax=Trinickia sp. NRRL B-1857 TaxID=3162879 RepID=UPI003D28E1B4
MLVWFWLAELAVALAAYVAVDGIELGIGILSGFAATASWRDRMVASMAPVEDRHGTWLVVAGTFLFGAFPAIYSIAFPALYVPLSAMLAGFIMRFAASELRRKAHPARRLWDHVLFAGSLLAAFAQGVAIGTCAKGVPLDRVHCTGNEFAWASVFPLWSGIGAVLCYAMLGAGWLALDGAADLHRFGCEILDRLTPPTICVFAAMFVTALITHPLIETRSRLHPALFVLPALSAGRRARRIGRGPCARRISYRLDRMATA